MWGGFGDALNKAAALASQTIQDLDREAGLSNNDEGVVSGLLGSANTNEEDLWNEEEEETTAPADAENVEEEGWNEEEHLDDLEETDNDEIDDEAVNEVATTVKEELNNPDQHAMNDSLNEEQPQSHTANADGPPNTETIPVAEPITNNNSIAPEKGDADTVQEVVVDEPQSLDDPEEVPSTETKIAGQQSNVMNEDIETETEANVAAETAVENIQELEDDVEVEEDVVSTPVDESQKAHIEQKAVAGASSELLVEAPPIKSVDASIVEELKALLAEREGQLFSKTQQLSKLEEMHSSERQKLQQQHEKDLKKLKEEAKRRMQVFRDKAEAADALTDQIEGLKAEGAKMARREADANEKAKRARSDLKDMVEDFEATKAAEEKGRQRIAELEVQLKATQDDLSSARKGESQAGKLDSELRDARDLSEKRATVILRLEQEVKLLTAKTTELESELKQTEHHAAKETEEERRKLSQEKHEITSFWQEKLKHTEDDAEQRETKLQKSLEELRKSLTEAERRAHSTATEVESNTVPLLRKLEDAEARHRKRAAEWSESESKLRQELNQSSTKLTQIQNELTELKNVYSDLDKSATEYQDTIRCLKDELAGETEKVESLESKISKLQEDISRRKKDYERLEQSANENASRIRSDLRRALHDAEETISSVRNQLESERRARAELEKELAKRSNGFSAEHRLDEVEITSPKVIESNKSENSKTEHRIRKSEGQAEILAGALGGLLGDDADDESEEGSLGGAHKTDHTSMTILQQSELAKRATEVKELRERLKALEDQNSKLLHTLGESRSAREELPEALKRLEELAKDNEELRQENQALQEDLSDVRRSFQMTMDELTSAPPSIPQLRTPDASEDS